VFAIETMPGFGGVMTGEDLTAPIDACQVEIGPLFEAVADILVKAR